MKKPTGLGRGLGALIPEAAAADHPAGPAIREIEVGRIVPNPRQPRRYFDEAALAELAESIAERGVLQPILVRAVGDGYELIAGERRWRASQRARLHRIPAVVRDGDAAVSAEVALIENIQREDLSSIEEAEAYKALIDSHGHTQDVIAKLVGKSRSHVANLLRLLDLPDTVRQMLLRGDISMGHARALATSADAHAMAERVVRDGLSVRQVEQLVREAKPSTEARGGGSPRRPVDADLAALERQLGDMLGLRVRVAHGRGGGMVQLHYSNLDQLDMICQRLSGEPI